MKDLIISMLCLLEDLGHLLSRDMERGLHVRYPVPGLLSSEEYMLIQRHLLLMQQPTVLPLLKQSSQFPFSLLFFLLSSRVSSQIRTQIQLRCILGTGLLRQELHQQLDNIIIDAIELSIGVVFIQLHQAGGPANVVLLGPIEVTMEGVRIQLIHIEQPTLTISGDNLTSERIL